MIESHPKIALVTPLKDELENIDRFLQGLKNQTVPIYSLVIVENDSTDGSKEYLEAIKNVDNIERFEVLNINFEDTTYRVGKKYATIVKTGFEHLKTSEYFSELDFIGILDSDIFPEIDYYEKLMSFFSNNPKLGIASGLIYTSEGKPHMSSKGWVRGGCRLWRKDCFLDAGYEVVFTADTISVALAHLNGWQTQTDKSARVISREVNVRFGNSRDKGYHSYYRGHTIVYAFFKFLHFSLVKRQFKIGLDYIVGYVNALINQKQRIEDKDVRNYFRFYMINKLLKKY